MTAALRLVGDSFGRRQTDQDLEDYLAWAADLRGLRPNTLRCRRDVLTRMSVLVSKPLRDVTEAELLRWEQRTLAGRAAETRRAYLSHARAFYAWAVKMRIVAEDPTTQLTQPKLTRGLPRPISEADLRLAVEKASPKMRVMLLLGAFCGLRCQEIAGVHWSDLQTDKTETVLLVREGKGGKERVVPVPGVVLEAMLAYGRRRSGPMFYGRDAGQMTPNSVSQGIGHLFARIGIHATAHQLRHRYATTTYRLSKDIRMVQELLGHSSPQTTARYAAYDKSQTVDLVKAMDAAWSYEEETLEEIVENGGVGLRSQSPPGDEVTERELADVADALAEEPARTAARMLDQPPSNSPTAAAPVENTNSNRDAEEKGVGTADTPDDGDRQRLQQAEAMLRTAGFVQGPDGDWKPPEEVPRRPTVNDLGLLRGR